MRIVVGTDEGMFEVAAAETAAAHRGRSVTALAADGSGMWAILDRSELWSSPGSDEWQRRATLDGARANCVAATRAGTLVGSSEAHLYRMADERLERVDPFDHVEGRDGWYTPWGGPPDTRTISEDDDAVYVNVHVGGILRSADGGDSWRPTIDVDADVHRVLAAPQRLFAACALGLAVSEDGGGSWTVRADGLHASYCRAVAVAGDAVLVSASTGPRGDRSAVYRGSVSGGSFERCANGLPDWFDDNIDSACLDAIPSAGSAAFGTTAGRVFASTDEGAVWAEAASGLPPVRCLTLLAP
jgi:hypothetical protein